MSMTRVNRPETVVPSLRRLELTAESAQLG
jgi:hypothetical protein